MSRLKQILVEISLFLLKFIIFLKRLIAAFFVRLLWKPGRFVLHFLFYKVVLKIYKLYLVVTRKLGLRTSLVSNIKINRLLTNRYLGHLVIIGLTIFLLFYNLNSSNNTISSEELVAKTVLAKLVENEFGDLTQLIEDNTINVAFKKTSYLKTDNALRSNSQPNNNGINKLEDNSLAKNSLSRLNSTNNNQDNVNNQITEAPSETKRSGTLNYIVKQGDSISLIAKRFGITVNTILWANNLTEKSYIKPGDTLTILPTSGISHKVAKGDNLGKLAKLYDVDIEQIAEANNMDDTDLLEIGRQIIIPGGSKLRQAIVNNRVVNNSFTGISAISDIKKIFKPKTVDTKSKKMTWPTAAYRITQYYSWRHTGLDIAAPIGTPIYAAEAGTVETVGWNRGGYGNQIIINHGNGRKTRYAHLSRFAVKTGQSVSKGQYIAAMGSTGRSTGPHLHFEVMISGSRYNPLSYIKY